VTSRYLDESDLVIPSYDTNAKTVELATEIHPGQATILDSLVDCEHLPFRNRADVLFSVVFPVDLPSLRPR
jgi:hypothetical protein